MACFIDPKQLIVNDYNQFIVLVISTCHLLFLCFIVFYIEYIFFGLK